MKERPILFSAPMVRALLDGTKTQTRRALKPQPPADAPLIMVGEYAPALIDRRGEMYPGADVFGAEFDDGSDTLVVGGAVDAGTGIVAWCLKCPFGEPGDRLWVREAFAPYRMRGTGVPSGIADADYACLKDGTQVWRSPPAVFPCLSEYAPGAFDVVRWRPSIHMPRWASRITLEITDVRVQRLHDISNMDAISEGVEDVSPDPDRWSRWRDYFPERGAPKGAFSAARLSFLSLWESINSTKSVVANPWVWALTFKRVQP